MILTVELVIKAGTVQTIIYNWKSMVEFTLDLATKIISQLVVFLDDAGLSTTMFYDFTALKILHAWV